MIAYNVARAHIESMLAKSRTKAGPIAPLRDSHDRPLYYGSTPMSVVGLELLEDLAKPLAQVRAAAAY